MCRGFVVSMILPLSQHAAQGVSVVYATDRSLVLASILPMLLRETSTRVWEQGKMVFLAPQLAEPGPLSMIGWRILCTVNL